ncbi:unnamed protein product, partial [Iphiclides podalirius]
MRVQLDRALSCLSVTRNVMRGRGVTTRKRDSNAREGRKSVADGPEMWWGVGRAASSASTQRSSSGAIWAGSASQTPRRQRAAARRAATHGCCSTCHTQRTNEKPRLVVGRGERSNQLRFTPFGRRDSSAQLGRYSSTY